MGGNQRAVSVCGGAGCGNRHLGKSASVKNWYLIKQVSVENWCLIEQVTVGNWYGCLREQVSAETGIGKISIPKQGLATEGKNRQTYS